MIRFIRRGGRIIPIRHNPAKVLQGDLTNIHEVSKARAALKAPGKADLLEGAYWKGAKQRAKITGASIAKRIARFTLKGIIKK